MASFQHDGSLPSLSDRVNRVISCCRKSGGAFLIMEYAIVSSPGAESLVFLRTLLISEILIGLSHSLYELMASCSCSSLVGCWSCKVLTSSSCSLSDEERVTNSKSSLLLSRSGSACVGGCCAVPVHLFIRCHIALLLMSVLFLVS